MSQVEREFDIIVYGASGFTGTLVAKYALKHLSEDKVALAGRNLRKLEALRQSLDSKCKIFSVDSSDTSGLVALARRTKVLLNCAGPFSLSGLNVVRSCIQGGADYVDITGEPNFIDQLGIPYSEGNDVFSSAVEAGVLVIPACGFDSVPADLGVLFSLKHVSNLLEKHAHEVATPTAESLVSIECLIHFIGQSTLSQGSLHGVSAGTFYTILESLKDMASYRRRKSQRFAQSSVANETHLQENRPVPIKPRLHYMKRGELEGYALPLQSSDPLVVRATARQLGRQNPQSAKIARYCHYVLLDSRTALLRLSFQAMTVFALSKAGRAGRRILKYWKPDGYGPDEEVRKHTRAEVHFFAEALVSLVESNRQARVRVHAICNTIEMYEATAVLAVETARCLIVARPALREKAGCFTCGAVLGDELLSRLLHTQSESQDAAIKFNIAEQEFLVIK
jgi:short subunit dehydrogenase-like uncharacterized protein